MSYSLINNKPRTSFNAVAIELNWQLPSPVTLTGLDKLTHHNEYHLFFYKVYLTVFVC